MAQLYNYKLEVATHTNEIHIKDNSYIYTHEILVSATGFLHRWEIILWVEDYNTGSSKGEEN